MLPEAMKVIGKQLGLNTGALADVLGLTAWDCARFLAGRLCISANDELFERIINLLDIHRALARLVHHDQKALSSWLSTYNERLQVEPLRLMGTPEGSLRVLMFLGTEIERAARASKIIWLQTA